MCWLARRSEKSEYPPDLPITSIISGRFGRNMNKKRFYVYGHFTVNGNKLFYIGKGTAGRKICKNYRSKAWNKFTSENEWYSKILHDNLDEISALNLEAQLIESVPDLINHHTSSHSLDMGGLEEIFEYSDTSPTKLIWKTWNRQYNHCRKNQGDVAGSVSYTKTNICQGYRVGYNNKEYRVHRIIMYLLGFNLKNKVVDHKDGNPLNNDIKNLRAVEVSTNTRNIKLKSNNTTGHTGVYLKTPQNRLIYQAKVNLLGGKQLDKSFSVLKHGLLPAYAKAVAWRQQQIQILNQQGAGYTERHGMGD